MMINVMCDEVEAAMFAAVFTNQLPKLTYG